MKHQESRERAGTLKSLLERLESEEDIAQVQADFNQHFSSVSVEEIAAAEELLLSEGVTTQDIGSLCSLHTAMLDGKIEEKAAPEAEISGHPVQMFLAENKGMRAYIDNKVRPLLDNMADDRPALLEALRKLGPVRKHYDKKDNLLFPYLERAGITGPSTVMWENESRNKAAIRATVKLAEDESAAQEQLKAAMEQLLSDLTGMMTLEEEILMPMVLENVDEEGWVLIAEEALDIGYIFLDGIEGAALSDANTWLNGQKGITPISAAAGEIKLPTGSFQTEQLRAVLNTLELDITVIDHEDRVIYFNEMSPRYFSRTKTILGRSVYLCHPPQALDTVRSVIADLKSKKKKSFSFYFPRGDLRLLIQYFGLYNEDGEYLGCLEAVQNLKPLEIFFEGSQTKEPGSRRVSAEEMAGKSPAAPAAPVKKREASLELTLGTRLNEVLDAYPEAFEILKSMSPKYKQLDNPIMLKTMGAIATMAMIAKRGGFEEEDFLFALKKRLGLQ